MQSVSSVKTDDLLNNIKNDLPFSKVYYETVIGKNARSTSHTGFYSNSKFDGNAVMEEIIGHLEDQIMSRNLNLKRI